MSTFHLSKVGDGRDGHDEIDWLSEVDNEIVQQETSILAVDGLDSNCDFGSPRSPAFRDFVSPTDFNDGAAAAQTSAPRTQNSWSRHGGNFSRRTGSDNMQTVMQTIVGMDAESGLYLFEPTPNNLERLSNLVLECNISVKNDKSCDKHPVLDFNKMLFTADDIEQVAAWWKAKSNSSTPLSGSGIKKLWKKATQFIHDWGLVAIPQSDLRAEGPFCSGFVHRNQAWNAFGYRLAQGGRTDRVPAALRARYDEIIALKAI